MESQRLPPHDPDAEEAVLGCLLLEGEGVIKVSPLLKPQDFFREKNRFVYQACLDLWQDNKPVDQISVAQELQRRGKLEEVGGAAYLLHLLSIVPSSLQLEHYAQIVHRLALMRQLIEAGGRIAALGYEANPDVEMTMNRAEGLLFRLRTGEGMRDFVTLKEVLDLYFEETARPTPKAPGQPLPHVFTGFALLDEWLGGLQRSDLIILAARPSLGKTSLALGMARNAGVLYGAKVALFSLEMSRQAVAERLLAGEAEVDTRRLRLRLYNEEEEKRLMDAMGTLSDAQLFLDDSPQLAIAEIRSKARRLRQEIGLDLVIVDYLQLIQGEGRGENRVQEISYISRSLKALARELDVPVLAVSQLSRAPEWRASHRPLLSDLRESGGLEQDADVVMFIYREEIYTTQEEWEEQNPTKPYPRGVAEIIIGKHRNGPTGEVNLLFIPKTAKFTNLKPTSDVTLPGFSP